jgi:hypothetical protein
VAPQILKNEASRILRLDTIRACTQSDSLVSAKQHHRGLARGGVRREHRAVVRQGAGKDIVRGADPVEKCPLRIERFAAPHAHQRSVDEGAAAGAAACAAKLVGRARA